MSPDIQTIDISDLGFPCRLGCAVWTPRDVQIKGTVIAVHGLSRQKRDFDDMAIFLVDKGYKVIAVDAPGRGGSAWLSSADDYTVENYAHIFAEFLKQEGLSPVHWVGTSMGGLIALEMAQQGHADVFSSVTFVDITHKPNTIACARIAEYMVMEMPTFKAVDEYLPFLKANLPLGDVPDTVWQRFANYQLVKTPAGYAFHFDVNIVPRAKEELAKPIDLSVGLAALTCPVALVAGEISDLCTAQEIAGFKKEKPTAQVYICKGAGHIPALYDDETNGFIYGVLNSAV